MSNVKPKLGNAEGLFKYEEPKGLEALAPKNPVSRNRIGLIAGFSALVCLIISVVLFQQNNQVNRETITASNFLSESDTTPDQTIAVVRTKYDNGELVGTLVHMENSYNSTTAVTETTTTVLTENERARLLEIISSK